jgi:hypothetical protein
VLTFELAEWEVFEAPASASGDIVEIRHVWIDDEQRRIYGAPTHGAPGIWLHPDRVPARVLRRDPTPPRHPLEWRAIIAAGRERIQANAKPKAEDKLAALPPRGPVELVTDVDEMPRSLRNIGKAAATAGFVQQVRKVVGPRTDQHNNLLEMSTTIGLRGDHADGRRFIAAYITKTGERGAKAGVTEWKPDYAYVWLAGRMTPCGVSQLAQYFTNGSLTT